MYQTINIIIIYYYNYIGAAGPRAIYKYEHQVIDYYKMIIY